MKIKSITIRAELNEQPPTSECIIYYENGSRIAFPCDPVKTLDAALAMAERACPLDIKSTIN